MAMLYFVTQTDASSSKLDKNFTNFNSETITKIEISTDSTIILTKENNEWRVDNYKANQSLVTAALNDAKNIKLSRKVSSNKEKHSKYDVEKGTKITFTGDSEISFILGKQGTSYQNIFIRKPDSDDVFTTVKNFKSSFEKSVTDWKEKSILAISKNDIASISVNNSLFLTNLDSVVMIKGVKKSDVLVEANSDAVNAFSKFSNLKTLSFPVLKNTQMNSILEVVINEKDGDVQELSVYKHDKSESNYYLLLKGNKTLFEISTSVFDVFTKKYSDLKK